MRSTAPFKKYFSAASLPAKKKRPTVAEYCLTKDFGKATWILIGVPDDRGVKNNYGRVGAKKGPDAFRESFFAQGIGDISPATASIFDLGNLKLQTSLSQTLDLLRNIISEIKKADSSKKFIVIGGGHDIAYGEIAGCIHASHHPTDHHIVNIDAHADVRPLEAHQVITSGTPFYRLIEEVGLLSENYHPFGLQRPSNNPDLVKWMNSKSIEPYWLEKMPDFVTQQNNFHELLENMNGKPWHLSVDMDGFPSAYSPGVSAPGVFGVFPEIFLTLDRVKSSFQSLESIGIYELAPNYDENEKSQRLAAKITYLILSAIT